MFLKLSTILPPASESSMVSLSGLYRATRPGWRSLASVPRHHQVRVAFADFADRQAVSVQRRDAYSPHSIPRSLRWSFITASRRHFAPCPENDKAGNTARNASFVRIKPGKIGLIIRKNTGHRSIYGPLLSVRLLSHAWPNSCVPNSTVFYLAQYGGWQRAATAIFIVTPRADKIVLRFFSLYEVGTGTFL